MRIGLNSVSPHPTIMPEPRFTVARVSVARVTDEVLLQDLRRVAGELSQGSVTERQYREHGTYDPMTLIRRFGSWNEALTGAQLDVYVKSLSDEALLADLRRVADSVSPASVSKSHYRDLGNHDFGTFIDRFGSWSSALAAAGLELSKHTGISDERLFSNILVLWEHYGRQPRRRELEKAPSTISPASYWRRFKSWTVALEQFADYMNVRDSGEQLAAAENDSAPSETQERQSPHQLDAEPETFDSNAVSPSPLPPRRRGPRDPTLRLRWRVLTRDSFRCRGCGASPAIGGPPLHVDHIVAWSLGGDTVIENLQTLCASCNLGKSDLPISDAG